MRTMPDTITDPSSGESISLPATDNWQANALALIGRPITPAEHDEMVKMWRHNWTVRVAAEKILGHNLTTDEVDARKNW